MFDALVWVEIPFETSDNSQFFRTEGVLTILLSTLKAILVSFWYNSKVFSVKLNIILCVSNLSFNFISLSIDSLNFEKLSSLGRLKIEK
jgi:hypothetical protein